MVEKYGISLVGFKPELVINPFRSHLETVQRMVLISTTNERAKRTVQEIESFLNHIGVQSEILMIRDIFDFFEVSLTLERLFSSHGKPSWMNVSAGPGSGISALSISATLHDIPLVSYDMEADRVIVTDVGKLLKLRKYSARYIALLEYLYEHPRVLKDISDHFKISKSAMSRRLKTLANLKVVRTSGAGRGRSPMTFLLTDLGDTVVYGDRQTSKQRFELGPKKNDY